MPRMALVTRQTVLRQVAIAFPDPAVAAEALESLDSYGKGPREPAVDVVQVAIIVLSNGKVCRLRELVKEARHDFRDVLLPAQRLVGWSAMLSL